MPYKNPLSDTAKRSAKESRKRYLQTTKGKEWAKKYRANRKEIRSKEHLRWRSKNPEYCQERLLKIRYGISKEEFEQIRIEQNNTCPICLKIFEDTPCVDHDHETGRIRGLLHRKCNRALGFLGDSTEAVSRALDYLRKHEETNGTNVRP